MSIEQFTLPDLGEGLTEAEIVAWQVSVGDPIALNQPLVEVETAKAVVAIPSPFTGRVCEILHAAGDTVDVGQVLVRIDTDTPETAAAERGEPEPLLVGYGTRESPPPRRRRRPAPVAVPAARNPAPADGGRPRAKPPVRKLARDLQVDLVSVRGTGPDGVITRADVLAADGGGRGSAPDPRPVRESRRLPIKGVRGATARAMVASAAVPQVTVFHAADVTACAEMVDELRVLPAFADVRVSPLLLAARALLRACRIHPELNSCWDDDGPSQVVHGPVHLGIAADTPRGLLVPCIKDADTMTLRELAVALAEAIAGARAGRLAPGDLLGSTITITNVGVFGVDCGAPLLNPGEGAILCVGAARQQPWVHQNAVTVRTVMQLGLTVDHRIIDGALASRALVTVASGLERPLAAVLDQNPVLDE
ncbi:MAG TPA: dihydrolipoamide acetyltransferase family protein [Mycobacteriales bacterium]|nr:dihydrolipoamide acetyltransferase family protein [Mycobacteriales bacterium]